ncbi:MAG: zinc-ribbon domain-containing protein [Paracoccaceae bacterium]
MRLICPNCDAQYDVPDSVIPTDGRDVQCSSCGTTWFQHHPEAVSENDDDTSTDTSQDEVSSGVEPSQTDEDLIDEEPAKDSPDDQSDEPTADADPEVPFVNETQDGDEGLQSTPQPRKLDSSVQAILRAEAERETEAREHESLETQPELGLNEAAPEESSREKESRERVARIRDDKVAEGAVAAGAAAIATTEAGSRRDLLPDIEEINSTLRSTNDRRDTPVHAAEEANEQIANKRTGGFRRGFVFVVALAAIAGLVYTYAPQIAQKFPQADATLNSYVTQVDSARVWLDSNLTVLLTWLDKTAAATSQ